MMLRSAEAANLVTEHWRSITGCVHSSPNTAQSSPCLGLCKYSVTCLKGNLDIKETCVSRYVFRVSRIQVSSIYMNWNLPTTGRIAVPCGFVIDRFHSTLLRQPLSQVNKIRSYADTTSRQLLLTLVCNLSDLWCQLVTWAQGRETTQMSYSLAVMKTQHF